MGSCLHEQKSGRLWGREMYFEAFVVLALYWIARQNNVLKRHLAERVAATRKRGYDDGHRDGYKRGHNIGYQEGWDDGFDESAVKAIEMGDF